MSEIRVATVGDAAAACEVLRRSILEGCVQDHRNDPLILARWLRNKTPDIVESWFAWPAHFPLVALADDDIVGVAMLSRPGKIVLLHVSPERRFAGIGTALLQALEARAARTGAPILRLASTFSAQRFYERHGYVAGGTTNTGYGTALVMSKHLGRRYAVSKACRCGAPAGTDTIAAESIQQ
jgi:GNAT superfamily N-acetyltransferase